MRLHFATAVALLPLALAAPAQAQSRYGPASPIPPLMAAPIYGEALTWSGKVAVQGQQTPQGALPQPLSPWAQRQAAQSTAGPAVATLPPSPSTPRPIAGSPTMRGTPAPEAAPAPAPQSPAPVTQAAPSPQASSLAPVRAPAQGQALAPVQQAAAPPLAARGYPGYGVAQLPNYPGYQGAAPAPAARTAALAPPAPAPAAVQSQTGGHVYSVGREYGMQPDAIGTRAPQGGTEMFLTEVPSTPSLAGYDESDDQPRRRQSDETTRP